MPAWLQLKRDVAKPQAGKTGRTVGGQGQGGGGGGGIGSDGYSHQRGVGMRRGGNTGRAGQGRAGQGRAGQC